MSFTLRASRPEDGAAAVAIWKRAVAATHDFLVPDDRAAITGEVEDFLPRAPMTLAVDEHDRPLGLMIVDGNNVDALFVDPDAHGMGIGRALMRFAATGHETLRVDVNEANQGARQFYERLGFLRVGRSEKDGQGRPYPLLHLEIDAADLL